MYLDLNHWYSLGAAAAGHPRSAKHEPILALLRSLVSANKVSLPLSSVHYIELTENPRDGMRAEAALVMAELSRFATLAPIAKIITEELDVGLNQRFGRPTYPERCAKFGEGIGFAFGEYQHLSLDIGSTTSTEREELETRIGMPLSDWEDQMNAVAEYIFLTGPPQHLRAQIPGYDPYAARREADNQLASFNVMVHTLRTDPDISQRPLDAIAAREFCFSIPEFWARALLKAGFGGDRLPLQEKEEFTAFLMSLPSRRVSSMMQFHYLKDVKRDWTINDLRDIAALSRAIPYCDVVVTDKKAWDTAVNRAHLDTEMKTVILRDLQDLPSVLSTAA